MMIRSKRPSKLNWPDLSDPAIAPSLTPHQRSIALSPLARRLGILGGPPGTGKTFTAAAIIREVIRQHGSSSVGIAAPTGKAAVRLMHSLNRLGMKLQASTIHRLLGVTRGGYDGKGWGFHYNADNPLPYRFLFIDEASMIDTDLGASLFSAIEPGTHVLLIGDIGQLPPVGHGAPLRDLIAGGVVPYGELTEIKRNAGDIVLACHDIRFGRRWQPSPRIDAANGHNLLHIEQRSAVESLRAIQRLLGSVPVGVDPIWDVQVICAVNAKSAIGRRELNRVLQQQLNPTGKREGNNPFRLGDKVICTTNTLLDFVESDDDQNDTQEEPDSREYANDPENHDGREFVANGEIGRVVHVAEKFFHVRFDQPRRTVKVPLSGKKSEARGDSEHAGAACDFDLAYAITVHKSQGSSARIVIYVSDDYPGARMVCCRELIYTALSRAEELAVTVGRLDTIYQDCRRVAITRRKTFLMELVEHSGEHSGVGG